MLSRVADNLYWMSRYFERADHCARVLEANYNLMLNPSKASREQRWHRITASLGFSAEPAETDPQTSVIRLIGDTSNRCSMVSCIASARENASQVREQISSEMWEQLNQLYHEIKQASFRAGSDSEPLRVVAAFRERSYTFQGITDATMNHGEGWHFIHVGKYIERAYNLCLLLDAHFSASVEADDLDWVGLLTSCTAFEAYCKVYTAELRPSCVSEFLLLNSEFPYSVRYSADCMHRALQAIAEISSARKASRIERIVGRLRSSLAYLQIEEIMSRDLHSYLHGVVEQCHSLHAAVHQVYTEYPIESAFEA
jgi:uncharacterized alpha-E superfamily protein